jgi:hypothetical protein
MARICRIAANIAAAWRSVQVLGSFHSVMRGAQKIHIPIFVRSAINQSHAMVQLDTGDNPAFCPTHRTQRAQQPHPLLLRKQSPPS